MRLRSGVTEIGVHSLSHLFRNRDVLEHYRSTLKRAGVRIVATNEEIDPDAAGDFVRKARRAG